MAACRANSATRIRCRCFVIFVGWAGASLLAEAHRVGRRFPPGAVGLRSQATYGPPYGSKRNVEVAHAKFGPLEAQSQGAATLLRNAEDLQRPARGTRRGTGNR